MTGQIVMAITGASGAVYGRRLLELLVRAGRHVHLVISPMGRRLLADELGLAEVTVATLIGAELAGAGPPSPRPLPRKDREREKEDKELAGGVPPSPHSLLLPPQGEGRGEGRSLRLPGRQAEIGSVTMYPPDDLAAVIASGSFRSDGMVICPCSSNTLAAVAAGLADNLITRAAHVTLKEARRLVLVNRETPLSPIEIENQARLSRAGAIICPASPAFYHHPRTIDDLVDFVVCKVLDLLAVESDALAKTRYRG